MIGSSFPSPVLISLLSLLQASTGIRSTHKVMILFSDANGYRIYVDIMTGEKFRLLTWTSLIVYFVHPVRGEGIW